MAELVARKDLTKRELKWDQMKDRLEARRVRILDPRVGDVTYRKEDLDVTCAEKRERQRLEWEAAVIEGQHVRKLDNAHKYMAYLDWQNKRNISINDVAFRQEFQLPQQRRDYDLYDRHKWKSERAVTFQDPDVQGPAAMYNFVGYKLEDPTIEPERKCYQRAMLDIQSGENVKKREREEEIERLRNQIEQVIGDKAEDDHRRVVAMRRADAKECDRINAAMVADKARHRQCYKDDEMKAKKDEINHWKGGELLAGQFDKYDTKRKLHWRGHTPAKRMENFNGLTGVASQVQKKRDERLKRMEQEQKDFQAAKNSEQLARALDLEAKLRKYELEKNIQAANLQMNEENKKCEDHLNNDVYGRNGNQPTAQYWNQFGISGR
ncbi:hypothetical protein BV898_12717 [Hypsibius exemplaris]|uniref:RIB43A-like with coiled-coils protein 2 n=1 Tax=Hypsibius exemplaris TaxID=2072580 RepID=A0A1W0WCZ8_HYPEX|nr:hypothetical protein BV898_12717 [Hypsibius exemplaris]